MDRRQRRCKATAKTTGKPCGRRGKHGCPKCGVCRSHGCNCKNPGGAPKGNQNARRHGLYSEVLTEDLRPHLEAALAELPEETGALGAEIALARAVVLRFLEESRSMEFGRGLRGAEYLNALLAAMERIAKLLHRDAAIALERARATLASQEAERVAGGGGTIEARFRWRIPSDRQAQEGADP